MPGSYQLTDWANDAFGVKIAQSLLHEGQGNHEPIPATILHVQHAKLAILDDFTRNGRKVSHGEAVSFVAHKLLGTDSVKTIRYAVRR